MPSLKDLTCSIELTNSRTKLQEFGTFYGDGFVETFVPMHYDLEPFSVHLKSNGFIAPGIAMYVFIDGVYQCNRNRQNLKLRNPPDRRSCVDFRVRQKEEKLHDGSMVAREWSFGKLNNVSADDTPGVCSPSVKNNIGCIEVLVLRCSGSRDAKPTFAMNVDGASDMPDHHFGLDGHPRDWDSEYNQTAFDDRSPYFGSHVGKHDAYRVPSRRSVHFERDRAGSAKHDKHRTHTDRDLSPHLSHHFSRMSVKENDPVRSNRVNSSHGSPLGFQYGSGPIPHRNEPSPARAPEDWVPSSNMNNGPPAGQSWLDEVLTKAVKRGIKESQLHDIKSQTPAQQPQDWVNTEVPKQPPGAWPISPFGPEDQEWGSSQSDPAKNQDGKESWGSKGEDDWSNVSKKHLSEHDGWTHIEPVPKIADGWGVSEKNAEPSQCQSQEDGLPPPYGVTWGELTGNKYHRSGSPAATSDWGNSNERSGNVVDHSGWKSEDQDLHVGWGKVEEISDKEATPDHNGWAGDGETWDTKANAWIQEKNNWNIDDPQAQTEPNNWSTPMPPIPRKSLSKYRQLRSPITSSAAPKSHLQFPPPPPTILEHPASNKPFSHHSYSGHKIGEDARKEQESRARGGTPYGHIIGRPEYIDRLDKPYATFRFKYRTPSFLSTMFGNIDISPATAHTPAEEAHELKAKLARMPRDKLVDEMLKMKMNEKLEAKEHGLEKVEGSLRSESVAREWTEDWVRRHLRG